MARKKQEDPPKGSPAWMNTFSDLMNLLLCFFVLLFSMSTVDADKFRMLAASFVNEINIFQDSSSESVGDSILVSNGMMQLNNLGTLIESMGAMANNDQQADEMDTEQTEQAEDEFEKLKEAQLAESERMAEEIKKQAEQKQIQDKVEITYNSQYVLMTLNGALLFDSGDADIREESIPLVDSIGDILLNYQDSKIEIEGHTDNVPIHNSKYRNNRDLSCFRALAVASYYIDNKGLSPEKLKYSGYGEYSPIADNSTDEGRARNRRVEIKIHNKFSSN